MARVTDGLLVRLPLGDGAGEDADDGGVRSRRRGRSRCGRVATVAVAFAGPGGTQKLLPTDVPEMSNPRQERPACWIAVQEGGVDVRAGSNRRSARPRQAPCRRRGRRTSSRFILGRMGLPSRGKYLLYEYAARLNFRWLGRVLPDRPDCRRGDLGQPASQGDGGGRERRRDGWSGASEGSGSGTSSGGWSRSATRRPIPVSSSRASKSPPQPPVFQLGESLVLSDLLLTAYCLPRPSVFQLGQQLVDLAIQEVQVREVRPGLRRR